MPPHDIHMTLARRGADAVTHRSRTARFAVAASASEKPPPRPPHLPVASLVKMSMRARLPNHWSASLPICFTSLPAVSRMWSWWSD